LNEYTQAGPDARAASGGARSYVGLRVFTKYQGKNPLDLAQ
jgi:hypothetical protein